MIVLRRRKIFWRNWYHRKWLEVLNWALCHFEDHFVISSQNLKQSSSLHIWHKNVHSARMLELLWRWWFSVIDPLRALHISLHWRNILHQSDKNMKRFKSTFTMQTIFRECEHHYSLQFQPTIKCSPLLWSKKRLSGNIVSLSWASTCSADLMSFYRGDKRACWCWLKASREVFARFWAVWNVWNQFTRTFTLSLGRLSLGLIHKPHKLVGDGET